MKGYTMKTNLNNNEHNDNNDFPKLLENLIAGIDALVCERETQEPDQDVLEMLDSTITVRFNARGETSVMELSASVKGELYHALTAMVEAVCDIAGKIEPGVDEDALGSDILRAAAMAILKAALCDDGGDDDNDGGDDLGSLCRIN